MSGVSLIVWLFPPMVLVWSAAWGKANCTSGISRRRKKPRFWQGHTSNVLAIAFSPDGKLIASGANGNDAGVRLYATDEGETRILEGHQVGVGGTRFLAQRQDDRDRRARSLSAPLGRGERQRAMRSQGTP